MLRPPSATICSLVFVVLVSHSFVFVTGANPDYSYHVKIQDPIEANYQEKAETRKGDYTEGFYSVVEPNGALRTVTYTADEWGFKPTITYSYGHPVPPIKKVLLAAPTATAVVHSVPSVSYQQLYAPAAGAPVLADGFGAKVVTPVNQYAAAYPAPLVSVKETRQFIKSPQVLVTPQPQYQYVAAPPPPQPVYQSYAQIQPAKQLVQFTAVDAVPAPSPVPLVYNQPAYLPPAPQPTPTPAYYAPSPLPTPTPAYLPPSSTPVPTTYIPPPSPSPTYGPPAVGIRGASKTSQDGYGYRYAVPEVKLEYPAPEIAKVEEVKVERPNGEYLPPRVIVPPSPAPVLQVQQLVAPVKVVKTIQHVNYLQPAQPLVHKVHYSQPPPPPPVTKIHYRTQPVLQQQVFATPAPTPIVQPINYVQPNIQKVHYIQPTQPPPVIQRIQYSHEPAKIFHQQYHIAKSVHAAPTIGLAPAPAPAPVVQYEPQPVPQPVAVVNAVPPPSPTPVKYEDIVIQNQHVMRYAEAPVLQYVQPSPAPVVAVQPALPSPAPLVAAGNVKQNPLTFNYGFDTGVAKVSHSYYGSGW